VNEVFDELKHDINCLNTPDTITLQPSAPILFSRELNISLDYIYTTAKTNSTIVSEYSQVVIYGVSGINVYTWPALHCNQSGYPKKELVLYLATVEFYVNSTPPSGYTCDSRLIPDDRFDSVSFFSKYIIAFALRSGNRFGSASQAVCPFVFKNAQLYQIYLEYQVDSFLFVNMLRFQEVNDTNTSSINSSILYLYVDGYNYKLDFGFLHSLVFGNLTSFLCYGTIKSIQTGLFKLLPMFFSASFCLTSLGNFFHQIGIEWTNYMNNGSSVMFLSERISYTFPNKDFCIFAQFPFNKSIQLILDDPGPNVSLTYMWLCKKSKMSSQPCFNQTVNWTILELKLNVCKLMKNESKKQANINDYATYADFYQTRLLEMLMIEMIPFILIPCVCMIGLFFNWKIIQTIKENKKKELKEDFYKYMSANAKLNFIYCLILVFYPITSCNWRQSYYFCSSIFTTQFVQYYKIVMIAYFGEVLKMSANISYIMMTLNRYLLIGKDHAPWLVKIAKLEFKWVIRGSFLFSSLINIAHGWQYQASGVASLCICCKMQHPKKYNATNAHTTLKRLF
jgi:hypothetical protein